MAAEPVAEMALPCFFMTPMLLPVMREIRRIKAFSREFIRLISQVMTGARALASPAAAVAAEPFSWAKAFCTPLVFRIAVPISLTRAVRALEIRLKIRAPATS